MKRFAPLFSLCAVNLAGCAAVDEVDEDPPQLASQLRAVAGTDTTYKSVGFLRNINGATFCTATLIAPDVAMSAAHCFAALANRCTNLAEAIRVNRFVRDADGDGLNGTEYVIDDIAFAPNAYTPAVGTCSAGSVYGCSGDRYHYVHKTHDLMLFHLVRPAGAPTNPQTMPVLTSITDDVSGPYGVHVRLDATDGPFSAAGAAVRPRPYAVGYGSADDCTFKRRSGLMAFDNPVPIGWHRSCVGYFSCESANPTPSSCSYRRADGVTTSFWSHDGSYGEHDLVRLARSSSAPGRFDGVLPTNGDSGSPLAANMAAWGYPQIAMGTFSTGFQSSCGAGRPPNGYVAESEYAPTFSPENGRFIEQTRAYWATRFAKRSLGWHPRLETLGGNLTTSPAAASYNSARIDVFARGGDGNLWVNTYAGAPETWSRLDTTQTYSPPSVTSPARGLLDLFSTNATRSALHWRRSDFGWGPPENLGGTAAATTGTAAAGSGTSLFAFMTGTDNRLWWKSSTLTGPWSPSQLGWFQLSGTEVQGTATAVSWAPDAVDVFVRLTDGSLGRKWRRPDNRGWLPTNGYERLGGSLASDPVAVSWAPGRIDVFYRPASDPSAITQHTMLNGYWSPPSNLPFRGGEPNARLAATSFAPGRIDLYVRGTSNQLLHTWYPNE